MPGLTRCAIAFLLGLCAIDARADFISFVAINASAEGGCSDGPTTTTAKCQFSYSADQGSLNGTAVAYGDAFGLHAGVSVGAGGDISADIGGSAGSELIDFWTFTGAFPTVAIASLEITSHGIETANVGTGAASTQLNVSDGIASAECHFDNSGNCTANILFDPALGLSVVLNLAVKAECLLVGSGACSSDSDFLNTTFISALSFTDADGDPLDLTFTSESGLTFPMPQPTVDEPATVALLGIGIVGVVVTRRVAYRRVREQIVWHRKPQP